MKTRLYLFDMDGTLVDSREDLAEAANGMRRKFGLPELSVERVTGYVGNGIRKLAERALEGAPVDVNEALRALNAAYAECSTRRTRPYPGVDEGLRTLAAAGFDLGVVTNKPAEHAQRIIGAMGWAGLFRVRMAGGDTPELKPSPVPILEAMRRTGHSAEETCMVGDHRTDLEAARRAGVRSVFLANGIGVEGPERAGRICADFSAFVAEELGGEKDEPTKRRSDEGRC